MRKEIVFVAEDIDCVGGVQKFMEGLSRGLAERGHSVSLLGRYDGVEKAGYDRRGVKVDTVFTPPIKPYYDILDSVESAEDVKSAARNAINEILVAGRAKLSRLIANWNQNTILIVVQVGALEELVSCGLELESDSCPKVIAQYHGSFDFAKQKKYYGVLKALFPRTNVSLFLTENDVERFSRDGITNARLMSNGIERFDAGALDIHNREKTVISLGRYSAEKSLNEMIAAWALVAPDFPEWSLKMFGSGPLEKELNRLIEELGLGKSASLEGLAPSIGSVLKRSSINVMTSHREGFPLSLLEASAYGVPSVSFDAGPSTREIIEDGESGYVVDGYSVSEFAEKLSLLMADHELRVRLGARAYESSSRYDAERIIDRWEELFDEVFGADLGPAGEDITADRRLVPSAQGERFTQWR